MSRLTFSSALAPSLLLTLMTTLGSVGCGSESGTLEPLAPQTVMVSETLRVPIRVVGGGSYSFGFVAPDDLAAFDRTASISGTGAGGEFRWTPLSSHVGVHEIRIQLRDGGSVVDETPLTVTVSPSSDAAPIFLRPGAGNTYDLRSDPCVRFDIEVRDDDSSNVTIESRSDLPDGAFITQTDDKRAEFEWCPTDSQVGSSERWTIPIVADDTDHVTQLDYIVVLRGESRGNCPGDAPTVTVLAPANDGRVTSGSGYEVRARVNDDMGLRDAPLLFFSTNRPDDLSRPDVTEFEQLVMRPSGGEWTARVPSFSTEAGASQTFYVLVSATDNDDASGALCDHRTDSPLVAFEAVVGEGGGDLGSCEPCTASTDCESGLCATSASGGVCVGRCGSDEDCTLGTCGATPSVEGAVLAGCGLISTVCPDGTGSCSSDDGREEDDSTATATTYSGPISDGQICSMDPDYFRIDVGAGEEVTVTLDGFEHDSGDLDLQMVAADGSILATSAGTTNSESVFYCFADAAAAYAHVYGYESDANSYSLTVTRNTGAACCEDDTNEPNDDADSATTLLLGSDALGEICPADSDYFAFTVDGPSDLTIELLIEDGDSADLNVELRSPSGTFIDATGGIEDFERLEARVTDAGRYTLRVYGFDTDTSPYVVSVEAAPVSGCTNSNECPIDTVCAAGSCVDRACQFTLACPADHSCPTPGPGRDSQCGQACTVNADCRALEACKWFPEGRFCGRRGGGQNGDACSDFSECGGQRACLAWIGGTCARAACSSNADCETGTYCVDDPQSDVNVCARSCLESDDVCRSGYSCELISDVGGTSQLVCLPS